jgi:hypothetical protein
MVSIGFLSQAVEMQLSAFTKGFLAVVGERLAERMTSISRQARRLLQKRVHAKLAVLNTPGAAEILLL